MRRLGYRSFGDASVLSWSEVPTPMPARGEILVRTRAASLNATDTRIREGALRALTLTRSKPYGMGLDVAGEVEAIGPGVRDFRIGDRVTGITASGDGFADATIAKAAKLAHIPDGIGFAEAACVAMSGSTAVGVVEAIHPKRGSTVFVSGGSGGIGMFVVRLLVLSGCTVEASGSAAAAEALRGLGAVAHDYRALDSSALADRFDAVVDLSGALHFAEAKPWLRRSGTFYTVVPDARTLLDEAVTLIPGLPIRRARALAVAPTAERMRRIFASVEAGSLPLTIGAQYPLDDALDVLTRPGPAIGKLVFTAP